MITTPGNSPFAAGNGVWVDILLNGYVVVAFAVAVFLEAWIMRKTFPGLDRKTSLRNALIANSLSAIAALPVILNVVRTQTPTASLNAAIPELISITGYSALLPFLLFLYFRWILNTVFITILVKFVSLCILFKPRPSILRLLAYTLGANIASHLIIVLIPVAYTFIDFQIRYLISLSHFMP